MKDSQQVQIQATHFSGPIPPPEELEKYENITPGFASRIMSMAENQSSHRQALEKDVVFSNNKKSFRGQTFAFIIGLVTITFGFILLMNDKDTEGYSVMLGTVITLVGVFIYGKKSQKTELNEKRQKS